MNGRTIARVLAALLLVAVAIGVGTAVYNAGVTAGFAEAAQQAAASGDPVPVVPGHYGWGAPYGHGFIGFGFFGILFWILGIFLVFGLLRAAFGGWGGPGSRGGWGGPGGRGGRREMVEDWHREMHRRDSGEGSEGSQPTSDA